MSLASQAHSFREANEQALDISGGEDGLETTITRSLKLPELMEVQELARHFLDTNAA
jgi:hypothetical protein